MSYRHRRSVKTGDAGESAAELWFKSHGWRMYRTQPATRIISKGGKPIVIHCATGGIADYTGYRYVHSYDIYPIYTACEVKVADGDTMPASRLSQAQRDWMTALPEICRWVLVVWQNECEAFPFITTGSYKRGAGLR